MSSIIDWLAHVGKIATGQNPQPGSATLGPQLNPSGAWPVTGSGAGVQPLQDPALFQWLQSQGAGMSGQELVPHAATQDSYMQGGYVPVASAQVPDFESPMATDAQWGSQDRNASNTRHAEWEAKRRK